MNIIKTEGKKLASAQPTGIDQVLLCISGEGGGGGGGGRREGGIDTACE